MLNSLTIMPQATTDGSEVSLGILSAGSPSLCRGLHKLLQTVVLYMTTTRGSIPTLPNFGNSQYLDLTTPGVGLLQATDTIEAAISTLTAELESYLKFTTANLPDDERLGSIDMELGIGNESLSIKVNLTSAAGKLAVYDHKLFSKAI